MKQNDKQGRISLKDRFTYWFDNHMTKGSLSLIRALIAASVALAVLIAGLIILFRFNEDGENASVIWNSIATLINAWMPYFEEGSPGYLILMSVIAIAGVLFTSVLIGIVTSAIEEKIIELKRGNSRVLESGHTVILGFYSGEYTLIRQLILAAAGRPDCIVIADDLEREEMEQEISENIDVPKNFKIVCRTADITDPASLEKCSLESCRTVIISPTDDIRTTKAVLAVSTLLEEKNITGVRVNAIISRSEYRFPPSLAAQHNISTFQTNEILAKMITHTCTQTGLSDTFRELFNFEGSEFYVIDLPEADIGTFEDLMLRLDRAVPAGILRDGIMTLDPPADLPLKEGDRVLVFAEEHDSARWTDVPEKSHPGKAFFRPRYPRKKRRPSSWAAARPCPPFSASCPKTWSACCWRGPNLRRRPGDLRSEVFLTGIALSAAHIVILNDHEKNGEDADMETIFRLLNLRDIRARFGLHFNITVEMQKEHNQFLVSHGDRTDFLVTSSMSSLFLAQLARSPELFGVFREILSNEGCEIYLKKAGAVSLSWTRTVRELRRLALRQGYILLGCMDEEKRSRFNLPLEQTLTLCNEDMIIVLGEN